MQRAFCIRPTRLSLTVGLLGLCLTPVAHSQDEPTRVVYPAMPDGKPPLTASEGADAETAEEMKSFTVVLTGEDAQFEMVPIQGGTFTMGSPDSEEDRGKDEGPTREVSLEPFWIGRTEMTWDVYHQFQFSLDRGRRRAGEEASVAQDAWADSVSRPTPPYVPMDFGMGIEGYPAICMTQFAAKQFSKWISMKTGRFYRLPTEAEWEYACRAGTTTAYSFGDDVDAIDDYAWYFDNADDTTQLVAQKKANPWGLFDMHGNVSEWVLDGHAPYAKVPQAAPIHWPVKEYGRIVRGGSWDDDPDRLRSATRIKSRPGWKVQDPQLPKSIWYHTDARYVGFRLVRPLVEPPQSEWARYWKADLESVLEIQERQRNGER
ncbi:MAG: sulfatase activating formylglycine-generating enzyme [Planctomycetota bacterium]|jgi:formylglycine-generating enzyme required for sulfatase activity